MSEKVIAIVRLVIMCAAGIASVLGYTFDWDSVVTVIFTIIAAISAIYNWWTNNNVTDAAAAAQKYLDALKADAATVEVSEAAETAEASETESDETD